MKKLLAMLLAGVLLGAGALGLAGCGPKTYGTFYTLQEAYDNGYLTREDLMSIAYYYNGGNMSNETIMGEDYIPIPKNPEQIDQKMQTEMKKAYLINILEMQKGDIERIAISAYYGTYQNVVAVAITDNYNVYDLIIHERYTIADCTFCNYAVSDIDIYIKHHGNID